MKLKLFILTLFIAIFAGCASKPEDIKATKFTSSKYEYYNCQEMIIASDEIVRRVADLGIELDDKANKDTIQLAAAVLVEPFIAVLLEGGNGKEADEYSKLKGEIEAIKIADRKKGCGIF